MPLLNTMSRQITEAFTLNNAWKNLLTQAVADGYTGSHIVTEATILNYNATVAYVHLTSDGATNPTTAADGLPIGTNTGTAPVSYFTCPEGTDIATVWVHTAGNQTIKYSIVG